MTVIVLSKHDGVYHIHGDGRTSMDWMGVATNNSTKVHAGKDYIYGTCGNATAKVVIKALLEKTTDPIKLLRLMHHKDFKDILQDSKTLVATKKHGCYEISIRKQGGLLGNTSASCGVITWDDDALPQMSGSGSLAVGALLSQHDEPMPIHVEQSIQQAFKVNHTIGGKITQVSLDIGDTKTKVTKKAKKATKSTSTTKSTTEKKKG
jgi:hypothetical protein